MRISNILKQSLEANASDIILSSSAAPCYKINGEVVYLEQEIYTKEELQKEILSIMNQKQVDELKSEKELDFSIDLKWYARFRVNVFFAKEGIGAVFRPIHEVMPDFRKLGLPEKMLDFVKRKNGLILVTWSVGSWKSTTLTSLLDIINVNMAKHIITVEDPIEYVYTNKKSLIEQREVWTSTKTFENGLKYALRQASDVIMIWEMRDLETFRLALRAAETGNLVLATLHTSGAARTVARIVDMFPAEEREQIRGQLADSLIWVVWQDLLKTKDKKGRVVASELLVNNTAISNMIRKWVNHQIDWAIETGWEDGMITMRKSLEILKKEWKI